MTKRSLARGAVAALIAAAGVFGAAGAAHAESYSAKPDGNGGYNVVRGSDGKVVGNYVSFYNVKSHSDTVPAK